MICGKGVLVGVFNQAGSMFEGVAVIIGLIFCRVVALIFVVVKIAVVGMGRVGLFPVDATGKPACSSLSAIFLASPTCQVPFKTWMLYVAVGMDGLTGGVFVVAGKAKEGSVVVVGWGERGVGKVVEGLKMFWITELMAVKLPLLGPRR